ncbi:MAG: excinuclease ABC subunit A [Candidatus Solincola sediminis]|uniref:UvrABC system protein A n=1 Tax=Candidatus Solincola sediminis TaxID=1797199 RepID=A0A1F2WGJ9_9ACTN|nr:MAG: excinuclease ABC subunit A [Candidatus Solincola sediminis]OFW56249.1 MAG: excinuclease ABC subunit A [Candidatus Solincola sediminis]
MDWIAISGAREHNLKNVSLRLPRDRLIVMTGLSGSGKSSLAFDTIYAEGQRRYVESLSSYARQFLGQMDKPDVDHIDGLSPAISIDQKSTTRNPRSTVGTITEVHDYLRLLYARIGRVHCPGCGRSIERQTSQQIIERVGELEEGTRLAVLAPVVRGRKGEYSRLMADVRRKGYSRVRIDGELRDLDEEIKLERYRRHDIEVVVDRLVLKEGVHRRLADSLETALELGDGTLIVSVEKDGDRYFSEQFSCPECDISLSELEPRMFSFNSPYGACPECSGLGYHQVVDPDLVVPNDNLSLNEGAIVPWPGTSTFSYRLIEALADKYEFSLSASFKDLPEDIKQKIFYGSGGEKVYVSYRNRFGHARSYFTKFEGIINVLERRFEETDSEYARSRTAQYMSLRPCPACHGARLKPTSLAVTVAGLNIYELSRLSIKESLKALGNLGLTATEEAIAARILKEIRARLGFLVDVGLDYLSLDRAAATLAGGEAQRIRLATQIGSGLVGVLYILDEPSIGLHQKDNQRLISTLEELRDLGNTLIVVEHDEATIRAADFIVDIGPGAGEHGGEIVYGGPLPGLLKKRGSITAQYLRGEKVIRVPEERRRAQGRSVIVRGAREHNLKGIDAEIPLGLLVCVTGVSGSGKSTLVHDVLYRGLARKLYHSKVPPGKHSSIEGLVNIDKIINIDQSPIGRTPRSNPATYTSVFDHIRKLFAETKEARVRGYKPGRFSFNVKGGRCEACRGDGTIKIEMHFLPDVYIPCEVCQGKRYNKETLEVAYKGRNISQVLDMSVEEALEFFQAIPTIRRRLQTLNEVGLGYIKLGQPAPTLSGGEAQRVKLSSELNKIATGKTLYLLDEPTTGLHFDDVDKLLSILQGLVDSGNTIVVIEHNLDVIKSADWIIDLGPDGGEDGGYVVAQGTPEEVSESPASYTGEYLKQVLGRERQLG